jgi:hypothetical protein
MVLLSVPSFLLPSFLADVVHERYGYFTFFVALTIFDEMLQDMKMSSIRNKKYAFIVSLYVFIFLSFLGAFNFASDMKKDFKAVTKFYEKFLVRVKKSEISGRVLFEAPPYTQVLFYPGAIIYNTDEKKGKNILGVIAFRIFNFVFINGALYKDGIFIDMREKDKGKIFLDLLHIYGVSFILCSTEVCERFVSDLCERKGIFFRCHN